MNNIRFSSIDTKLLTNKQIKKIVDIQKDIFINTHQGYNSDLCVFPRKSLDFFRENGDLSLRSFLKNFRLNK